ncbi:MAG: NifB/NifX family molybdenum-iron cluster-binding protein [Eubacteriales bacterium]|nr:NifB/NifX family molybdenum-iron cluster-binding protein [Eubacteriales bacterium]
MKFAAAYENGQICQDFSNTKQFKLYTVEDDRVVHMEVVDTGCCGAEALTGFLKAQGVGILVCGRLESAAQMALLTAGIAPFPGAYGDADMQVGALLVGMLEAEKKEKAEGKVEGCTEEACAGCAHREQCAQAQ